jgi:hypothetical protein
MESDGPHVMRSYIQHIAAPPARVFPLLCPVREAEWVDGWEAKIVHSISGLAELGCIFTTSREGEQDTIWTVSRYEPDSGLISFVMVTPGSRVGQLDIEVSAEAEGSACSVTYTFTSLSEHGDAFIRAYTEDAYVAKMQGWERAIGHYLATGEMLKDG